MKILIRAVLAANLLFLLFFSVSCADTLPKPSCPQQPTQWTVGKDTNKIQLNPADYPVAPRAPQTSIDIEFSQLYMHKRIRTALEAPPPDNPIQDSGIFVGTVGLTEQGTGAQKINLLTVQITPWQRGASGTPVSLQRSYRLKLKIVPYLITSTTIPDEQKRRAFLQSTDTGAALRFDLIELYSLVNQEPVSCSSSHYDIIDSKVLGGVYTSLAQQDPLVLPAKQITSVADKLLGSPTQLVGMNVGSDLELKIGLLLDQGTPTTFDPQADIGRFPNDDETIPERGQTERLIEKSLSPDSQYSKPPLCPRSGMVPNYHGSGFINRTSDLYSYCKTHSVDAFVYNGRFCRFQ